VIAAQRETSSMLLGTGTPGPGVQAVQGMCRPPAPDRSERDRFGPFVVMILDPSA
jgi:hypothetical protein